LAAPSAHALAPEVVARGLSVPWGFAFLPDSRIIVTERGGAIRIVGADGKPGAPLANVPAVQTGGQGGMLDIVTDRAFVTNRTLYFCFTERGDGGAGTALARARLSADANSLEDVRVIFRQVPKINSGLHFGCRIVESRDGLLFLALGDRGNLMNDAQRLDSHIGKVVRLTKDGAPAPGNPFAGQAGALPEIWSYGHRNQQGAMLGPDGALWTHEHGPQGGDEVNIAERGRNYGWPIITYGEHYGGGKIGEGITERAGLEQPLRYWVPSIAPSGMAMLSSTRYGPQWQGSVFVGSLRFRYLARLQFDGRRFVREERLLEGLRPRVRDVREGPDGLIYIADESSGQIIKLVP
jgi:glucose/arabinose dehydrogenase